MPHIPRTPEHQAKIVASNRLGRFDRIADPLWHAIHNGRTQEVARLMAGLSTLVERDKRHEREASEVQEESEVSSQEVGRVDASRTSEAGAVDARWPFYID